MISFYFKKISGPFLIFKNRKHEKQKYWLKSWRLEYKINVHGE
jgi:hypothetical protein